jgi:kynurenine 3-monooxygenase
MPELVQQWESRPTGTLVTTRTAPWHIGDWVVLVGDACHAVYPFYGQGMNSAFEDCAALNRELERHENRGAAFAAYQAARKPHTDTLAELSKENFVELRQKVRSPLFLFRKRMDVWLNRLAPKTWLPLYTMIAHTTMPYGEALTRAKRQDRLLLSGVAVAGGAAALVVLAMLTRR